VPSTPTAYERRYFYGPFHRLLADEVQDAATVLKQLLSGEVWGKTAQFGLSPAVKAYRGPLSEEESGIEFWTFQEPDRPHGTRSHWSKEGDFVTIEGEFAKLSVIFVRVTQEYLPDAES
jgi:hypothetical protein